MDLPQLKKKLIREKLKEKIRENILRNNVFINPAKIERHN